MSIRIDEDSTVLPKAARACLQRGFDSGKGAEVEVTSRTTEGDAIRTHLRELPNGEFEAFADSTDDTFGSDEWTYERMSCHNNGYSQLEFLCD